MNPRLITQYSVFMANKPGSLARLARLFYERGVNIVGIASEVRDDTGMVRIALDTQDVCSDILSKAGFASVETRLLSVELEDKPGQLHRIAQILGDGGVNITTVYGTALVGQNTGRLLFAVDDANRALDILKRTS
ncbi:MAG: ACT domain-containing protein [Elusimicrobia bacterium]|nr:ACT domain-containing protein [Elusimicrobiota bacterium]